MLIVLEIGLTIAAWKRGWKGWALLPWVIALVAAFIVSLVRGAATGVVADVVLVGTLIIMVAKPRQAAEPPQDMNQPAAETDDKLPAMPEPGSEYSDPSSEY